MLTLSRFPATAWSDRACVLLALIQTIAGGSAVAAPLALLDRNGSHVSIEAYAPNIVRVTLSIDKDLALAPPGFGIIAAADATGWKHRTGTSSDEFSSDVMSLEVKPQPWPSPPSQMQRYFAPSLPPVSVVVRKPGGNVIVQMSGWEMAPHTVNGEKTFLVGATFEAPADEHYYGLGQQQKGWMDLRDHEIRCWHDYGAIGGEDVCVPFMVSTQGYGLVWDNPSKTTVDLGFNGQNVWSSEVGDRVSYFVIAGETSDEIYEGYRLLTGVTHMTPQEQVAENLLLLQVDFLRRSLGLQ